MCCGSVRLAAPEVPERTGWASETAVVLKANGLFVGERMMVTRTWFKWGLLVAGSTLFASGIGACIREYWLMNTVMSTIN